MITNPSGFTQVVEGGTELGCATSVTIVELSGNNTTRPNVGQVISKSSTDLHQKQLTKLVGDLDLPDQDRSCRSTQGMLVPTNSRQVGSHLLYIEKLQSSLGKCKRRVSLGKPSGYGPKKKR